MKTNESNMMLSINVLIDFIINLFMQCDCRFAEQTVCGEPIIANIIKSCKMSTGFGYVPDLVAPLANLILSQHSIDSKS